MSLHTLQIWKAKAEKPPVRKPGRPRHSDEARAQARVLVLAVWRRQGVGAGERCVYRALGGAVPLRLVRSELRELKREHERRSEARIKANRVHTEVHARDAMWSGDATELARETRGVSRSRELAITQANVLRDVASTESLSMRVGPPPSAEDVIVQLERTAKERGAWPHVLVLDNGGPHKSEELAAFLRTKKIVVLLNEPYTPEHNPWVEHGHRALKEEAMLDLAPRPFDAVLAARRLEEARVTLDHCRLRQSRQWRTAVEYGLALPPAEGIVSREVFYEAACRAIGAAEQQHANGRERRRAVREAILCTLESFGLVTRTRGGLPYTPRKSAVFS